MHGTFPRSLRPCPNPEGRSRSCVGIMWVGHTKNLSRHGSLSHTQNNPPKKQQQDILAGKLAVQVAGHLGGVEQPRGKVQGTAGT